MSKQDYNRRYYEANRGRLIEAQKAYYAANVERIRAQRALRREQEPETLRAQERAAYQRNRETVLEKQRQQRATGLPRLKEHGLSCDQYDFLVAEQARACAICLEPFAATPRIDHDHATGEVRGLLCHSCNVALGHFRDNPDNLRRALRYLDTAPLALMEEA